MNIRKNVNYSEMYAALDIAVVDAYSQMQMYAKIGTVVCTREEKGAAVAAAEYLHKQHPDIPGFSPRNLRRMREFYRIYSQNSDVLGLAMQIGWTQNVVILEAELTMKERAWYIRQVISHNWSKKVLIDNIKNAIHLSEALDDSTTPCYTDNNIDSISLNEENTVCRPSSHPKSSGRDDEYTVPSGMQLFYEDGLEIKEHRLRRIPSSVFDGTDRPTGHVPYLRRRLCRENVPPG